MADQEMGGVNISISADSSQAERQMAQFFDWFTSAGAEATKLSSSIGGVMNKMSQMGKAGSSSSKNVISSYNDVQRQAQKTRDTASQIGSALKKSADRGIAGYQTLTKGVKSDNVQMSKDTQAKFSKMEGSSKKSFDEMYRDSKTFNSLLKKSTKASFGELGQGFRDLGNGFKSVGGNIKNVASSMGGWFKTAAGAIANAFRHPIQTMQSLGGIARDAGSKVSGFISSGFSMAKDLAISQLDKLKGGLSSIAESAKVAGNRAKNFFVTGFNGIVTGAGNILSSVGNTLSNLPDTARQAGANVKDWFVRNIKGIPGESDSIWTRIKNGVMSIPKKARNAGATIKEKLGNVWRSVKNASGKFLPGVKSDMKQNIDKPSQKSKMSVMDMAKAFGLVQIAGKAFNGLKNQMSGAINRMDTMNNSSRAFENMGFTAKETEGAMDGLDKALEGMPTPLDEAVQGVQLLASSTDDVGKSQKVFNSINDAILGFGGSTEEVNSAVMQLSQGFSKGKIQGEEWNSMINSQMGPALNAMADNMNMSTDEMREGLSDGTISIDEFQDQLIKLDEEGGGDLKALRQVAQDATDGIKTSFGNMGISIQRGLVEVVESFNDFVKDVTGSSIADWITRFGEAAEENLSKVGDVLQSITPYIKDFINFLKDNGPVIKPIIAGIGAAFATWVTIKTATAAISGLISAVTFLASPMGIFLTLVAAAVAAGVALYQNWDTISKYAGKVADFISNAWGSAVDWIKEKWSGFTEFFSGLWTAVAEATVAGWEWIKAAPVNAYEWLKEKWNGIVEFFVGLWTSVTETTAEMWAGIKEFFNGVVLGFKESWNGIVEFFVNLWNSVKETIVVAWQGIVEFFTPIVQAIMQPFMPLIEWFGTVWNAIKNITAQVWNIIKAVIMAPVLAIVGLVTGDFGQLKADMQMIWNNIKGSALSIWNSVKTIIVGYVKALVQTAKNLFNNMKNGILNIWNGIKAVTMAVWNGIKTGVVNLVRGLWNGVKNIFNALKNGVTAIFNAIKSFFVKVWTTIKNTVVNLARGLWNSVKNTFNALKNGVTSIFNGVKTTAINIWTTVKNKVVGFAQSLWNGVKSKFNALKSGVSSIFNSVKDVVIKVWSTIKDKVQGFVDGMKKGVTGTVGKMRDSIEKIVDKIKGFFMGMVEGVVDGLNKLIDGVNWVGDKLGMGEIDPIKLSTGTEHTETRNLITNGKVNQDTLATVGDKGKGNGPRGFRNEMIRYPNGEMFMTPDYDTTAYLPKGSSVFNGAQTHAMLNGAMPKFAGGTLWDKTKDFASGAFNKAKDAVSKGKDWLADKVGDVWDWVSKPGKLVDKVLEAFGVNFDWIQGSLPSDMMGAMFKKLKTATKDLFTSWFDDGKFDGDIWKGGPSEANGVYSYLVKIAKKVVDKYPGMSITSGYRPGDKYYHGKRQAIDVAYPASDNGSSKYKEPANWVFKKFKDQIAYVIALNKIKDRTGMGGEGKTMSWANWASGGHMDHLHINGMFGPGDVSKGGGGSGVGRWKKTAIKALKMTGDYTKSNLSALMAQMKSESNGNPKSVNNWDSNAARGTPSKGLMQMIQPTFDSYKMKGHGNIYNALDNILAAIRYTKANYTSLASGWRGVGYENGGMVSQDGLYRMGEGNKNEMVLPLTKPKRAMELIMQALQYMSNNGSSIINQAVNGINQMAMNMPSNLSGSFGNIASSFSTGGSSDLSSIVNLLEENNRLTEQNTELLAQVRDKDNNTYLNDKKMSKGLGPSMDKVQGQRRKNKERGLNN